MAGSPCPVEVMKRVVAEMHMAEVTIAYGMTETSPVSTQTRRDDDLERRVSTVGTVHPHVEVKVVDPETGLTLPRGEPGELCTRGYSVMLGYWEEPEKTADVLDAAGWMHTGDLATMDADGYLNIVGRIKDLVIRGGENVYPREIEEFLYSHPDTDDLHVRDVRVRVEELLDLARVDVLAAADHEVLDPADDVEVAVAVHGGQVAGVHPPRAVEDVSSLLRLVPVADHHRVAAGAQLTGLAARQRHAR